MEARLRPELGNGVLKIEFRAPSTCHNYGIIIRQNTFS
jgi:hypothetical protein